MWKDFGWDGGGNLLFTVTLYVGRNPSEEMEWPSWSTKESEMQYLDAISKTTE